MINSCKYMVQIMPPEVVILSDHIQLKNERRSMHLVEQEENAPFVIFYLLYEVLLLAEHFYQYYNEDRHFLPLPSEMYLNPLIDPKLLFAIPLSTEDHLRTQEVTKEQQPYLHLFIGHPSHTLPSNSCSRALISPYNSSPCFLISSYNFYISSIRLWYTMAPFALLSTKSVANFVTSVEAFFIVDKKAIHIIIRCNPHIQIPNHLHL